MRKKNNLNIKLSDEENNVVINGKKAFNLDTKTDFVRFLLKIGRIIIDEKSNADKKTNQEEFPELTLETLKKRIEEIEARK